MFKQLFKKCDSKKERLKGEEEELMFKIVCSSSFDLKRFNFSTKREWRYHSLSVAKFNKLVII